MPPDSPLPPTDEALAAQGSIDELYSRYGKRMLGFLRGLGVRPADLEDLHHDVWVRVWGHLQKGYRNEHFRGWLFEIARNRALDWKRKRRPEPLDPRFDATDREGSRPIQRLLDDEHRIRMEKCLEKLSPSDADLIRKRLAGDDYDDLAKQLGVNVNRLHRRFFDVKHRMRACMERSDR